MQISDQAKKGTDFIFTRAAMANLITDSADTCTVEALPAGRFVEPPEKHLVVLTISSYLFRLLTIFHVNPDKATIAYFTRANPTGDFDEVFGELGNLCCGAMNREFGKYFPHLGMSTPYMLDSKCVPFIKELKPDHVSQHRLQFDAGITLHATLCFCAYAPIDFHVDMTVAEESTGELELF